MPVVVNRMASVGNPQKSTGKVVGTMDKVAASEVHRQIVGLPQLNCGNLEMERDNFMVISLWSVLSHVLNIISSVSLRCRISSLECGKVWAISCSIPNKLISSPQLGASQPVTMVG